MKIDIREQQKIILGILKDVIEVCETNHITYYCQAGTVLGAIRHSGFIPWDGDADIIIPNNEIDYFCDCVIKQFPKYNVDYYKCDDKSFRLFPRIGLKEVKTKELHLDVFRLIGLPDDRNEQLEMIKEAKQYTLENKMIRRPIYKMIFKLQFKLLYNRIKDSKMYDKKFDGLCNRYPYEKANYVMNPSGKYGEKNIFKKEVYGEGKIAKFEDIEVRIPSDVEPYLTQYYGDYMKTPSKEEIDKLMRKVVEI